MKKIMSILVLVCIVASLCTVSAWAAGGITVNGAGNYSTLADAIAAAQSGDSIELPAGSYSMAVFTNKSLTIKAANGAGRDSVRIDSIHGGYHGSSVTFSGVTIVAANQNYNGMQHLSSFSADNCVIENEFWSYATTASFNNCEFRQPRSDKYNIWTYGSSSVSFTGCLFDCAGKSVLVYNENNNGTSLTVSGCSFEADTMVAGKAAIEIDSSLQNGSHAFSINISNSQASGFDTNSNCGNQLWNEKKSADKATVTVGGTTVYEQGGVATPVNPNTGAPTGSNPPVNPNPNPGTNSNPAPAAPAVENIYYVPATDDNSNMALWSILALALLTTAFVTRKKKAEN